MKETKVNEIISCAMDAASIRRFTDGVKSKRIQAAQVNGRVVYCVSTLIVNREDSQDTGYTPALVILAAGNRWHKYPLAQVLHGLLDLGATKYDRFTRRVYKTEEEAVLAAVGFGEIALAPVGGLRLCEATAQKYAAIIAARSAAESATPEQAAAAKAENAKEHAESRKAKAADRLSDAVKKVTKAAKAANGDSDEQAIYALLDAIAQVSQIGQAIAGYARPLVKSAYDELRKSLAAAADTAERAARLAAESKVHGAEMKARAASEKEAAAKAAQYAAERKEEAAKADEKAAKAAAAKARRAAAAAKAAADNAEARIEAAKANGAK